MHLIECNVTDNILEAPKPNFIIKLATLKVLIENLETKGKFQNETKRSPGTLLLNWPQ